MNRKEFSEYKRERLEEIARVINESSKHVDAKPMELESIYEQLERLKSTYSWLR